MKKHIALGIAAAVLGVSSVAAAVVSVDQLTSAASSESSISAVTDSLAANCWMVTGSANDAGCNTSVAGLSGLPELPNLVPGVDIPDATGLLAMASNAVDTATGSLGSAQSIVGGLVPTAQGLASSCSLPVSLPVKLVPAGIFSAGLSLFDMAQNLAMNDLGAASLASPVQLPVTLPVTADDVINKLEKETGCLAAQAGGSPIPAACTGNVGLPSVAAGVIPSQISGLLGTVAQQLAGITGQGVNVAGNGTLGAGCDLNKIVDETPLGSVTSTIAPLVGTVTSNVPSVGSVTGTAGSLSGTAGSVAGVAGTATGTVTDAVGSVTGVTDTVGGVLNTVTGTVDSLLGGSLPLDVPALPLPTSCSASASGSVGGLLGSLTSTITGGCK
jgi:hypothetical protein